jgi:hypothetical protein
MLLSYKYEQTKQMQMWQGDVKKFNNLLEMPSREDGKNLHRGPRHRGNRQVPLLWPGSKTKSFHRGLVAVRTVRSGWFSQRCESAEL